MGLNDDKMTVTFTYLEMLSRPKRPPAKTPLTKHPISLIRIWQPTISFYRYLYNSVGEPWLWYERRIIDDEKLKSIIHDDKVEIYCLFIGGTPAGYAELNCEDVNNIQLSYFGLIPEFINKGFGRYFLEAVIDIVWNYNPDRLWLHTCSLDHPSALPNYQRRGFTPFDKKTRKVLDPRQAGFLPKNADIIKMNF